MFFKRLSFMIVIICFIIMPIQVFAGAVTTDGFFDDWKDKPYLNKDSNRGEPTQDIIQLRWYPNPEDNMLYFYCERAEGTEGGKRDKFVDWNFEIFFDSDGAAKRGTIEYHPPSNKVEVKIFDENDRYLWSAKGKWGDDKDTGKRIEFYIPLTHIAGSIQTGYQLNTYFISGNDRFPESGSVTISTVSTFPLYTIIGVILITLFTIFIGAKRSKVLGRD